MLPSELQSGVYDNPVNTRRKTQPKSTEDRQEVLRRKFRPKTWRNLLRPKYVKLVENRLHVNPVHLSVSTQATLAGCGGPSFTNNYTVPLTEHTMYDAVYYKNGRKGYKIDGPTQYDMLKEYFRAPVADGIYTITAEIRNRPLMQVVYAMLMHAAHTSRAKRCRWQPIYSQIDANRDRFPVQDVLVIDNVHADMDNVKFSYLRDTLYRHRNSVVFMIVDGHDPLEFTMRYIHVAPRMVLNIAFTRVPMFIRRI